MSLRPAELRSLGNGLAACHRHRSFIRSPPLASACTLGLLQHTGRTALGRVPKPVSTVWYPAPILHQSRGGDESSISNIDIPMPRAAMSTLRPAQSVRESIAKRLEHKQLTTASAEHRSEARQLIRCLQYWQPRGPFRIGMLSDVLFSFQLWIEGPMFRPQWSPEQIIYTHAGPRVPVYIVSYSCGYLSTCCFSLHTIS